VQPEGMFGLGMEFQYAFFSHPFPASPAFFCRLELQGLK